MCGGEKPRKKENKKRMDVIKFGKKRKKEIAIKKCYHNIFTINFK